ncbi:MAG: Helix-turn-helix domain [Streptosporangiaceae bacterium]|nr:Helix-turn-helix domain [Streptosporangiaceae bacterium]
MTDSNRSVLERMWFTPAEVMTITGVSRTEVYEALQTGELEGHQRGKARRWRVHRNAVEAWMRGAAAASADLVRGA